MLVESVLDVEADPEGAVRITARVTANLKIAAGVVAVLLVVFVLLALYLGRVASALPEVSAEGEVFETAETSIVYAADGSVIDEWHGEENRVILSLDQIPEHVVAAVIAVEDPHFYEHSGVDVSALLRSVRSGDVTRVKQGGSTITQQLVRILLAGQDRSFDSKLRELLLAYDIEARTEKTAVLETYLNAVYFGHGAYGVESAARTLFGHPASQLTLAQGAMLAGLIDAPATYSPISNPTAAIERRDKVLDLMVARGAITAEDADEARSEPLEIAPRSDAPAIAPYFVEWVKQDLSERLGDDAIYKGGLRVHTTLDPVLQRIAEEAAASQLPDPGDPEVALVALDHTTGAVLAMVGGRDFGANQFNLAVQGRRQPGSAFKPFVLVRALEEGVKPSQVFSAAPYSVKVADGVWNVENYENQFTESSLTLSAATNWSVNAVFARLIMQVGPADVVDVAKRMGIESPVDPNPAIALGGLTRGVSPLEMASAYGTIAAGGMHVRPTGIREVTDASGDVVYRPDQTPERAIEASVAVEASGMLHDVVESGTGSTARIPGVWAAGKTGTTQAYRDAWFIGYTRNVVCSVWVGHRDGQVAMDDVHGIRVSGGTFPARIWRAFMSAAIDQGRLVEPQEDSASGGGEQVTVCPESMKLANPRCPDPVLLELPADQRPTETCPIH